MVRALAYLIDSREDGHESTQHGGADAGDVDKWTLQVTETRVVLEQINDGINVGCYSCPATEIEGMYSFAESLINLPQSRERGQRGKTRHKIIYHLPSLEKEEAMSDEERNE